MKKHRPLPPLEQVKELFSYDANTGALTSLKPRKNWKDGPKNGYYCIRINDERYNVARLCWLLGTGKDPGDMEIDHVNRDHYDNRLENLRLATRSQQLANRKRTSCGQLPKGVTYNTEKKRYYATWGENGEKISVGGFLTQEEASLFYLWNTRHHGEFADPLPISACPPPPGQQAKNKRRAGTSDLPKGVSLVKRKNYNNEVVVKGYQTSFVDKTGRYVNKKGFDTPEEAHAYYLANRR